MKDRNKEPAGSWECTRRADKRKGDCGHRERRNRWTKRAGERVKERGRGSFSVHSQSWCAISNPSCSWLCAVAQQEVGAGQTTINKRAVKNTISHQWPTTGFCACHHGDGTTPLYQDYKTPFCTSPFFFFIFPFFLFHFLYLHTNGPYFSPGFYTLTHIHTHTCM